MRAQISQTQHFEHFSSEPDEAGREGRLESDEAGGAGRLGPGEAGGAGRLAGM